MASDVPGLGSTLSERRFDSQVQQWYRWNVASGKTAWCLAAELRHDSRVARVLVLAADEGSQGYSMFCFLSGYGIFRIMFARDPAHRLSNLFINTLKAVPRVLKAVLDILVVFKWRRAPYGGGRFWRECRQTLQHILDNVGVHHPVIEMFSASIARDVGVPPELLESSPEHLRHEAIVHLPIGAKVEMRRWFTFLDGSEGLDRYWHGALLSLVTPCLLDGVDPWEAALGANLMSDALDGEADADKRKYQFKATVLATLMRSQLQCIMRSVMTVCKRIRIHHGKYMKDCHQVSSANKYLVFWSDATRWVSEMVVPVVRDSWHPDALQYIGFDDEVEPFEVPLLDPPADVTEEQYLLYLHLRLCMAHVGQMLLYIILPKSPPWVFVRMLDVSTRSVALAEMRRAWELILLLESSTARHEKAFAQQLHFARWAVVREVLQLHELSQWRECPKGQQYVEALFPGFTHSIHLEYGFNDARDNEVRGARHMQRSDARLQASASRVFLQP